MDHYLKALPHFFRRVESGEKPFEIRKNDRDFQVGDTLVLQEWAPPEPTLPPGPAGLPARDFPDPTHPWGAGYTGASLSKRVTYCLHGGRFGLASDYVVMGLADLPEETHP